MELYLYRSERLNELRKKMKLGLNEAAEKIGIAPTSLTAYEHNDDKDISLNALQRIAEFYNVSVGYLICETDNIEERHTPIEQLHLTDDAVKVLKEQKVNPLLLSRIIEHPHFHQLMIDAEIYVDRIAETGIQNMNMYLESLRQAFINNEGANREDLWMQTLKAGQIEEDEYFGHVLQKDILTILKSIREDRKPSPATSDNPLAVDIEELTRHVKEADGSLESKAAEALFRDLDIDISDYSEEDIASFLKIFSASKKLQAFRAMPYPGKRGTNPRSHGPGKRKRNRKH